MKIFICSLQLIWIYSCRSPATINRGIETSQSPDFSDSDREWYFKDFEEDSIPGISLEKLYHEYELDTTIRDTVVVAVIDTEVDIYHEDLEGSIWQNKDEISGNQIDDDKNGYIDDIYGWNYLGTKDGGSAVYMHTEVTHLVRKYASKFENKDFVLYTVEDSLAYSNYLKAKSALDDEIAYVEKSIKRFDRYFDEYFVTRDKVDSIFSNQDYTLEDLKSYKANDTVAEYYVNDMRFYKRNGFDSLMMANYIISQQKMLETSVNPSYDDRKLIGDDVDDINDVPYGHENVAVNLDDLYHGTLIAGTIAGNMYNDKGGVGVTNAVKLMVLCVSSNGDERDKDIALAIRYAVDNGAKVINMSSSNSFTLHKDWVDESLLYAAEKDVLFITSAGNSNKDLDKKENPNYPNDGFYPELDDSNNFMMIGASTSELPNLKYRTSNYGKETVDLFAPGKGIYAPLPNNKYRTINGTSMATAITSGVAALIRSQYPELTASEIKNILMESGDTYSMNVEVKQENDSILKVPFSRLSKSGKVLNAYKAMKLAETKAK